MWGAADSTRISNPDMMSPAIRTRVEQSRTFTDQPHGGKPTVGLTMSKIILFSSGMLPSGLEPTLPLDKHHFQRHQLKGMKSKMFFKIEFPKTQMASQKPLCRGTIAWWTRNGARKEVGRAGRCEALFLGNENSPFTSFSPELQLLLASCSGTHTPSLCVPSSPKSHPWASNWPTYGSVSKNPFPGAHINIVYPFPQGPDNKWRSDSTKIHNREPMAVLGFFTEHG